MFYACRNLTVAPELPATSLAEECYYSMFDQCESISALAIKAENYANAEMVENCLKYTKSPFTLTCPQALIDKKGMAQIKEDFGLLPDDNIVALEVIESAILDDENHTATLTQGTKERNGQSSAIRLTFPDKITVDGEDYEVVAIAPEAFDDLEGVKEIVIECSRVPEIAPDAFDGKDVSGITLFVPEELVDDYRNTEPWSRFWPNIVPIREHVTTPQGEFIINNVDETADMISGGRPEDRPSVIVIPATVEHDGRTYPVTKVEPEVFADLSGIEEIFIHAEIVPYLDPHALDDKDLSGIILYVPDDLVEEYQNTYPWSLFPDIRPISEAGIETVTVGSAPVNMKYIENRRIVIRHNGRKYSVQGTLLR